MRYPSSSLMRYPSVCKLRFLRKVVIVAYRSIRRYGLVPGFRRILREGSVFHFSSVDDVKVKVI